MIDDLINVVAELARLPVSIGPLGKSDQVGLVLMGGQFTDRQLDGGKARVLSFQLLVKGSNQAETFSLCDRIVLGLDGQTGLLLGNQRLTILECTTTTNFVEKDSDHNYLYTALFKAEFGG